VIRYAALLLLFFSASGCEQKHDITPSGHQVTVDIIAPQQGVFSAFGNQALAGFQAGLTLRPLLPNGDRLEVRIHDSNSRSDQALALLDDINQQATVLACLSGSNTVLTMADTIQRNRLPTLAIIATHDDVNRNSHYLTRLSTSNSVESQIAASYVRDEMYIDTVAVVYNGNNTYSESLAKDFARRFAAIGGNVVAIDSVENVLSDTVPASETLSLTEAQLLYATVNAASLKQLLQAGLPQKPPRALFLSDGLLSDMRYNKPGAIPLINGALTIDHYADDVELSAAGTALVSYLDTANIEASAFVKLGYEGYLMIYSALAACPDYERECINDRLRNSGRIQGVSASFRSEDGHTQRPVYVNRIHGTRMLRQVKVY